MTADLSAYIVSLLLRYFRKGENQEVRAAHVRESDHDLLLLQWAISQPVRDLCLHLAKNPHEMRAVLQPRVMSSSAGIRGAIRASQTVVEQAVTADPARFVFAEPFRSYDSGPNRVLGWTISYAMTLGVRFRSILSPEASYFGRTVESLRLIEEVRRLVPFARTASPPTAGDVMVARSSRLTLYRKAAAAYEFLRAVERLDIAALEVLLSSSLVGPMHRWRQFELAVALAMAYAIADRTGERVALQQIHPLGLDALFTVGDYVIRWQRAAPSFECPELDTWEKRAVGILDRYGVTPGYDRPDVVVFRSSDGFVVAIGEAKYFESDNWRDGIRHAVTQIVAYSRGYERAQSVDNLIGRSLIALWSVDGTTPTPITNREPSVTTFAEMQSGLTDWASRAIGGNAIVGRT